MSAAGVGSRRPGQPAVPANNAGSAAASALLRRAARGGRCRNFFLSSGAGASAVPKTAANDSTVSLLKCDWCGEPFEPRIDGGKQQRFCSPEHRRAFDAASRIYVRQAIASGALTLETLRESRCDNARVAPGGQVARIGISVPQNREGLSEQRARCAWPSGNRGGNNPATIRGGCGAPDTIASSGGRRRRR